MKSDPSSEEPLEQTQSIRAGGPPTPPAPAADVVSSDSDSAATIKPVSLTNVALAVVVAALAATVLLDAFKLAEPVGYSVIGPNTFPIIVSIGLLISAIGIAFSMPPPSIEIRNMQWGHAALAVLSLSSFAFLVDPLGIALTVALLVPLQARLLGSRSPFRDVLTGIAFGLAIQLVFGNWLGLPVPSGLLQPIFGA